jgi:hypothetical protein
MIAAASPFMTRPFLLAVNRFTDSYDPLQFLRMGACCLPPIYVCRPLIAFSPIKAATLMKWE